MIDINISDLEQIHSETASMASNTEEILYMTRSLSAEIDVDAQFKLFPENVFIEEDIYAVKKAIENMTALLQDTTLATRNLLKELETK